MAHLHYRGQRFRSWSLYRFKTRWQRSQCIESDSKTWWLRSYCIESDLNSNPNSLVQEWDRNRNLSSAVYMSQWRVRVCLGQEHLISRLIITTLFYWKSYKPEELNLTLTIVCKTWLLGLACTWRQLCNTGKRWQGPLFLTLCQHSHPLDDQTGKKISTFLSRLWCRLRLLRTNKYTRFIFALIKRYSINLHLSASKLPLMHWQLP